MGRDIPLGRLAGIRVTMDLTVLLIAGVYTIALAENRFPIEAPDVGTPAHWIAGAGFALLFFASLLVHEIGHALVAQDEGIGVRSISLWLLGGVAKLESAPASARSDARSPAERSPGAWRTARSDVSRSAAATARAWRMQLRVSERTRLGGAGSCTQPNPADSSSASSSSPGHHSYGTLRPSRLPGGSAMRMTRGSPWRGRNR